MPICFIILLHAQASFSIGRELSAEGRIKGSDTVFHLSKAPLWLWAEARFNSAPEWDTLWIVIRSLDKQKPIIYGIYRQGSGRAFYRGRFAVQKGGIYHLMLIPAHQPRLVLMRRRLYVTDEQTPTLAALREKVQREIQAHPRSGGVLLFEALPEEIEVVPELLLPRENPPSVEEETLFLEEDTVALPLEEMPFEETEEEEEFELEDLGLEDL
ncbi:MAG: hypothetical protein RMK19_07880 [Bacteroidia bacterium]|nr:hypothetical protein [Bacteroidia bacterium]